MRGPVALKNKEVVDFVIPVHNNNDSLQELVERISAACDRSDTSARIILVDDASKDASWEKISVLAKTKHHVIGVKLSRNFGQHSAIHAGFSLSKSDWVMVMDADLQDDPESIPSLLDARTQGVEVIRAIREGRSDSLFRRLMSSAYYKTISWLTGFALDSRYSSFGLYRSEVVAGLMEMREPSPYLPLQIAWLAPSQVAVACTHAPRRHGQSSYSIRRLFRLAIDISIVYSDRLLRLTSLYGVLIASLGFVSALWVVGEALLSGFEVQGFASIMSVILVMGGSSLAVNSLVGMYLAKTYAVASKRPKFIISEVLK